MPVSRSDTHGDDLPMDPDVEDRRLPPSSTGAPTTAPAPTAALLAAIAAGGALGSLARYALGELLPPTPGGFPWATFSANVSGCLLLGLAIVVITDILKPSRYLRPFLAVGVLGGFTTFSTYTADVRSLLAEGHAPLALVYLFGTLGACLSATVAGIWLGRLVERRTA